ncbi:MAG TPA: hypothetical protein VGM90_34325 [Kofleriaceae bacterium]|jgi:hypothetical protein
MSKEKGDAKQPRAKTEPGASETATGFAALANAMSAPPDMPTEPEAPPMAVAPADGKPEPAKAETSDKTAKAEPPDEKKTDDKKADKGEEKDGRTRAATIAIPVDMSLGEAPAIPKAGSIETPAFMPGPNAIPGGTPQDPGTVPGSTPPGDSRSLRRGGEFALVYRVGTAVISRTGVSGTRGVWRVVEYPTSSSASNAYAKECSRFVAEGFSDYRE